MAAYDDSFKGGGSMAVSGYLAITVLGIALYHLRLRYIAKNKIKPPLVFLSLLCLSLALRALWLLLRAGSLGSDVPMRILNRGALLIFFSAYSLYVLSWAIAVSPFNKDSLTIKLFGDASLGTICLVVNVIVWLIASALIIAAVSLPQDDVSKQDPVYDADVCFIASCSMILVITFVRYGWKLHTRLSASRNPPPTIVAARRKIAISTTICAVCWTWRVVMFLWRPVSGDDRFPPTWDDFLYPWWFYTWPELLPGLSMVLLLAPRKVGASPKSPPGPGGKAGVDSERVSESTLAKGEDTEVVVRTNPAVSVGKSQV